MEIKSLNENLYDEFFVKELEIRLETDPLGVGGLVDLFDSQSELSGCFLVNICPNNCEVKCTEFTCPEYTSN
jgi:hypothetical protein